MIPYTANKFHGHGRAQPGLHLPGRYWRMPQQSPSLKQVNACTFMLLQAMCIKMATRNRDSPFSNQRHGVISTMRQLPIRHYMSLSERQTLTRGDSY